MNKRIIVLLVALALLIACNEVRVTEPIIGTPCEADSLRQVIEHMEFIIGQQSRMIRCLQDGGETEDCYGGI